jgi:hypothetical protein
VLRGAVGRGPRAGAAMSRAASATGPSLPTVCRWPARSVHLRHLGLLPRRDPAGRADVRAPGGERSWTLTTVRGA